MNLMLDLIGRMSYKINYGPGGCPNGDDELCYRMVGKHFKNVSKVIACCFALNTRTMFRVDSLW